MPRNTPIRFVPRTQGLELGRPFATWLSKTITLDGALLVILDSYTALRPHHRAGGDIVKQEQEEITTLDQISKEQACSMMLIHHESSTTKANALLDWDSRGAGTFGIMMAAESQIALARFRDLPIDAAERILRVRGRHMRSAEMVLAFAEDVCNYRHVLEGPGSAYYPVLVQAWRACGRNQFTPKELRQELGISDATVFRYLSALRYAGLVERVGVDGSYRISTDGVTVLAQPQS